MPLSSRGISHFQETRDVRRGQSMNRGVAGYVRSKVEARGPGRICHQRDKCQPPSLTIFTGRLNPGKRFCGWLLNSFTSAMLNVCFQGFHSL